MIFFSILIAYLFDIVLIMLGEILSSSLMGVKGLRGNTGGKFYWLLSKKENTGSVDKKKKKQNKTKHKKLCLSNPQHADN